MESQLSNLGHLELCYYTVKFIGITIYDGIATVSSAIYSTLKEKSHNVVKVLKNIPTIQEWGRITVFSGLENDTPVASVIDASTRIFTPLKLDSPLIDVFATPNFDKDRIQYITKIQSEVNLLLGKKAKQLVLFYYRAKKWLVTGISRQYTIKHEKQLTTSKNPYHDKPLHPLYNTMGMSKESIRQLQELEPAARVSSIPWGLEYIKVTKPSSSEIEKKLENAIRERRDIQCRRVPDKVADVFFRTGVMQE